MCWKRSLHGGEQDYSFRYLGLQKIAQAKLYVGIHNKTWWAGKENICNAAAANPMIYFPFSVWN